jgi:glyoxylase-like metal-dependent hydrolase (beta-lactamase superfamily II)
MPVPAPALLFDRDFAPETGRAVTVARGIERVTAPNAGPYTFTGTNGFIIGGTQPFVIDPGPNSVAHLEALMTALAGRTPLAILLTHTHRDHSDLVPRLKAATGAPVWFGGPHRLSRPQRPFEINPVARESDWALVPDRTLVDGEILKLPDAALEVIATPGHCANHLAFGICGTPDLLSGDHVMGWNSTLVSVPDGSMGDYFASLARLQRAPYQRYLPAHGGPIADGPAYASALEAHREHRNAQVIAAIAAGATRIGDLLKTIYPTLPLPLQAAARMTLKAHVEYLAERGQIGLMQALFGSRLFPIAA